MGGEGGQGQVVGMQQELFIDREIKHISSSEVEFGSCRNELDQKGNLTNEGIREIPLRKDSGYEQREMGGKEGQGQVVGRLLETIIDTEIQDIYSSEIGSRFVRYTFILDIVEINGGLVKIPISRDYRSEWKRYLGRRGVRGRWQECVGRIDRYRGLGRIFFREFIF